MGYSVYHQPSSRVNDKQVHDMAALVAIYAVRSDEHRSLLEIVDAVVSPSFRDSKLFWDYKRMVTLEAAQRIREFEKIKLDRAIADAKKLASDLHYEDLEEPEWRDEGPNYPRIH
ncbi:MAG: hypothetical protein NT003_02295 [Candidatus Magasanikbacteria bacterium]|nr:hypothetical protein [Candidatus Magasanikbacteria bacterium]